MNVRFRLRTLFVLTTVIAICVAYYGNRLYQFRAERAAVEVLEDEWTVYLDNRPNNIPSQGGWLRAIVDWPLTWCCGVETLNRRFDLGLYSIQNDTVTTLSQLDNFDFVDALRIDRNHSVPEYLLPKIDSDDFQYLRRMQGLRSLTINADLGDGLKHLRGLPLSSLSLWPEKDLCHSDFDVIGGLSELRRLELSKVQLDAESSLELSKLEQLRRLTLQGDVIEIAPDAQFPNLEMLSLGGKGEACDLAFLKNCPKLDWLRLYRELSVKHINQLASAPNLFWLDISAKHVDDKFLQPLRQLKLKGINFLDERIKVSTFEALKSDGTDVGHGGLMDFVLDHDYVLIDGVYHQIDPNKKSLVAVVTPGEDFVRWSLDVETDSYYAPYGQSLSLETTEFVFDQQFDEIIGAESKDVVTDAVDGNFYSGYHQRLVCDSLSFVSRDMNRIHILWESVLDQPGGRKVKLDAEFDFVELLVRSRKDCSIKEAKDSAGRFFDLERFEAPVSEEQGYQSVFRFTLKEIYQKSNR